MDPFSLFLDDLFARRRGELLAAVAAPAPAAGAGAPAGAPEEQKTKPASGRGRRAEKTNEDGIPLSVVRVVRSLQADADKRSARKRELGLKRSGERQETL